MRNEDEMNESKYHWASKLIAPKEASFLFNDQGEMESGKNHLATELAKSKEGSFMVNNEEIGIDQNGLGTIIHDAPVAVVHDDVDAQLAESKETVVFAVNEEGMDIGMKETWLDLTRQGINQEVHVENSHQDGTLDYDMMVPAECREPNDASFLVFREEDEEKKEEIDYPEEREWPNKRTQCLDQSLDQEPVANNDQHLPTVFVNKAMRMQDRDDGIFIMYEGQRYKLYDECPFDELVADIVGASSNEFSIGCDKNPAIEMRVLPPTPPEMVEETVETTATPLPLPPAIAILENNEQNFQKTDNKKDQVEQVLATTTPFMNRNKYVKEVFRASTAIASATATGATKAAATAIIPRTKELVETVLRWVRQNSAVKKILQPSPRTKSKNEQDMTSSTIRLGSNGDDDNLLLVLVE